MKPRTKTKLNQHIRYQTNKKTPVNFSIPIKYLTIRSWLPPIVLSLYSTFDGLIKFFSFFSLGSQHNHEICFLVHRRKVLEQITSVRVDIEIRLDVRIRLHGLTVYSLNSNFAYYCACEEYLQCNPNVPAPVNRSASSRKSESSRKSLQVSGSRSGTLYHQQMISIKSLPLTCQIIDLFSPNYFQPPHPFCGVPMEYIYYQISNRLSYHLPRHLQENIAPINKETCRQLELLYYVNLGTKIGLNWYQRQPLADTSAKSADESNAEQRIRAVLTGNPLKFSESLLFHLFNLALLLFTLLFGLNSLTLRQRPGELYSLIPILIVSPLFSLLLTEFLLNLYVLFIKRHVRFIEYRPFQTGIRHKYTNFAFVGCMLFATLTLLLWCSVLSVVLKQQQHTSGYLHYEFGYANLFLGYPGDSKPSVLQETLFLLGLFYLSVFIMLRFWSLLITLVRFAIALLAQWYYRNLIANLVRANPPIKVFKMASITSLNEEKPLEKSRSKSKRKGRATQSALDREMENNLLKYFTKK